MHIDQPEAKFRGDPASRRVLALAALLLALATACGAFGAHALKSQLPPERLQVWDTAVRYQFFQALGLLGAGLLLRTADSRVLRFATALIVAGTILFCGGVYALALGAPPIVGSAPPVAGPLMIAGWLVFAWGAWRSRPLAS